MDGESCIKKAYNYIWNADFEQAIYWFEQAIAAEPENASYYHKCAISCARSGKWQRAGECARQAVLLEPGNPEYEYYLQIVEAQLLVLEADRLLDQQPSKPEEAIPLLEQAARQDPLNFEAHYKLALSYRELGRLHDAVSCAREAVRLDHNHFAARRLYAELLRKQRLANNPI
ncbi:tetratricopeptide repeat protein [Paenibacillus thailandensis]|uniref:Tetratricopeptide repeat protein n=1 Tax=Paenibacillus thailandensis TaxID=393250 RepID=A0ABW5QZU6_9BACL